MSKEIITYYYRGDVERGSDYHWVAGYSANSPEGWVRYPWMTYRECQKEAKSKNCKAVFVTQGDQNAKRK